MREFSVCQIVSQDRIAAFIPQILDIVVVKEPEVLIERYIPAGQKT